MKRDEKAGVIDEIAAQIEGAGAIYAVGYRGLSVSQAAELRTSLREAGASLRIVKNTLTLRAADQAKAERVKELIEGPTAFTFVSGDPAVAAKALDGFARREPALELRGALVDGELLDAEAVRQLARLPGRDALNAQVAGLVAAPLAGLVRGLGSLVSGLAIALGQVREQREAAGETAPPPAEPAAEERESTAEGAEPAGEEASEAESDGEAGGEPAQAAGADEEKEGQ